MSETGEASDLEMSLCLSVRTSLEVKMLSGSSNMSLPSFILRPTNMSPFLIFIRVVP
jgi:hypothetical protein